MLEGLEVSIIPISKIDHIKKRIDSEYYKKEFLWLQNKFDKIGAVSIKETGAILDCSAFYPSITDDYSFEKEGVPFLRVNEIKEGLIQITDSTAFLPQEILDNNTSTIKIGYPDDIIIAKGGNTLAKLGLITDKYPYYALSRDIILLRTQSIENTNKYYLWVLLHSKYGQSLLWRTASQTGQPHLTLPSLLDISLPKFSKTFENKFENIYKKSIDLKNASKSSYSRAESLLLDSLGISDFHPSDDGVNIKSFKESFLENGRLDSEYYLKKYDDIDNITDSFKTIKISELFDLLSSPSPSKYIDKGVAVLKTKNVRIPSVDYSKLSDYTDNAKLLIQQGDLLFASMGVGSLGRFSYIHEVIMPSTIDGTLKLFRIKEKNRNQFFEIPSLLFLTSDFGQECIYKHIIGSTGIISISKENVQNLVIPILNLSLRKKLSKLVLDSIEFKFKSKSLLQLAKRGVEIAIEQNESVAIDWMEKELLSNDIKMK